MGNRSSKKKGTKTTTYTYTRGNLLSAISSTGNYYYNCDGVRYKKVSGGVTTEYYLDGDKILGEDRSDGKKLRYFYDIDGLCGVRYNGKDYEYVRNPYGDIVMIVIDGLPVVRYYYDAWGNCKMVQYKDGADIGNINPFRWKSHYYDVESGLYYANGSYYDPEAGLHVDAMPVSTAIENAFEVFGLDLNGIMCDNILAYLPYVYSAFTTIELTANQGYDPNANKSGWEIFWNGVKQSLANLSGAQKIGIVVGLLLVLVACVVVMVLAPEASAAVAAMGRVVIGFLIGVASSVAISTVTAMATGGDVAEAFVSSLADSILICGILAFVGAGISVIKAGVRSVRNAKLAGSSQTGAQPQSTVNYPPNNGFDGQPTKKILRPGEIVDRYGYDSGYFVSPKGTPFEMRSLPADAINKPYHTYVVQKPLKVLSGKIAPWFGQPGGGIQYKLSKPIAKLLIKGILKEL